MTTSIHFIIQLPEKALSSRLIEYGAAARIVIIETPQPPAQKSRLQLVEPRIGAREIMHVFRRRAVIAVAAGALGEVGIIGDNRAAIPQCRQILCRVEAEGGGMAE